MKASLKDLKDTVSGWLVENKQKQSSRSAPQKWVMGLIVAIVSIITLACLAYYAWRKGVELARLKHERDVRAEEINQKKLDASLARGNVEAAKHRKVIRDLEAEHALLEASIKSIDHQEKKARAKIDAIKNWEEVDAYLAGGDAGSNGESKPPRPT